MWRGRLTLPLTSKRLEEWNDLKSILCDDLSSMSDVIEVRKGSGFSKEVRGARWVESTFYTR
jgi:hypothetical protein